MEGRGGRGRKEREREKGELLLSLQSPLPFSFLAIPLPILEARSIRSYQHCLNCFYFCFTMNSISVTRNCIVIEDVDIHS